MKMKNFVSKKVLSLVLCLTISGTLLAGCGLGQGTDESLVDKATSSSKEYVFAREKLDVMDGSNVATVTSVGERVYASSYSDNGYITISSFNSDGSDFKSFKIPEAKNESHGSMAFDSEGNCYTILNVYNPSDYSEEDEDISASESGADAGEDASTDATAEAGADASTDTTAEAGAEASADADAEVSTEKSAEASSEEVTESLESEPDTDPEGMGYMEEDAENEKQLLIKYDSQGKELFRVTLSENLKEGEYYTVYGMIYTDKYGLIISSTKGIEKLNENDLSLTKIIDSSEPSSPYYQTSIGIYRGFQEQVFVSIWGDNGSEVRSFDPNTATFGDAAKSLSGFYDFTFFTGNGYDLYASRNDGFYGFDYKTDTLTKILDFMDSDIAISYSISSVTAISDTEFVANLPDENDENHIYRLTKVAAEDVKDKTIITLGGNYVDYTIRQKVYAFNDENPDYKIKIVDYSQLASVSDYSAGSSQFDLDIVSGNTPDIMFFTNEEPVASYINKGLFIDLSTYIKNDPDIKEEDFLGNIYDAFKTGDKVYQLIPSFVVSSVVCKTKNLNGRSSLTLKECEEMIEAKGIDYSKSFGITDRNAIMYEGLDASGNTFIDWENKTCNYNSEGFIEFLKFANKFKATISEDDWNEYKDTCYLEDEALFNTAYVNDFKNYKRFSKGMFGDDVTFIGFPNEMGENCSIIIPEYKLTISAQSKEADTCWQFIRQFLLEDYQDNLEYNFPIRKTSFDKRAEKSMEHDKWIDEDGKEHIEDETYWIGDVEVTLDPLTKEEVEYMKDFIGSLHLVVDSNKGVFNIINEEASAYFSGQKSAEEVADIIQSRVSIYVNENS